MASTLVLLLQLLLVSVVSASHYFGGSVTFTYKGRNPDGSFQVDFRNRATFDGCQYSLYWYRLSGNCGSVIRSQRGVLDRSTNAPRYNRQWCETETVSTRKLYSDKPFQMRASSCCWIPTRNPFNSWSGWRLLTSVDLGSRSDTGKPNRSPDIAILPFLRVPQNCPRTYKLISFDPDGDRVRCRYGIIRNIECYSCNQPSGFVLDQDSCTLHYRYSSANPRVYAFELVVEDFPQRHITLTYTDGSQSSRTPLTVRGKRQVWYTTTNPGPTTTPWWWWSTAAPATTTTPTTTTTITTVATTPWWWSTVITIAAPTTTAAPTTPITTIPTTPWWWWWSTAAPTTPITTVPTTPWWWWWSTVNTTAAPSTTAAPTTPYWYTTTAATTTPITTVPTTPRWWWWSSAAPATTTAPTTTTTTTITTVPTTPWWWWWSTVTTTAAPSTTAAPTTPYWYTTAAATTNIPYWNTKPRSLSRLPLQFSFLVDPPAPSCQEGLYLPKFVHPTPDNGVHLRAEVDKEVEIRVKAQATFATIHDIIISGPLNISKHKTTHDEFVIRWTPKAEDLGDLYPICFAVESVTGSAATTFHTTTHHRHYHPTPSSQSGIYQSEMRCVLVDIKKNQVKTHVICNESSMTVAVEKSSFPGGLHEDHLRLSDPTNTVCSLQTHSNSTHIIAVVPLNACGTQIEEDDDNLIFKNEITTVDDIKDLITRKHQLELQFDCQYPKRGNVTRGFIAHRLNVTVWDKGFGKFTYQFEFYPDGNFQTMIDPNLYPLEYDIGDRIYMQIEATSSVNNTELFVESCTAAPYDNPNYRPTYSIIDNGCKVDSTVEIHSSAHERQFKFSMEAFRFIGLHDQVYISCSVLMCEEGSQGTRCSKGCMNSTRSGGHHHHRRKREAVAQSSKHFISQGPLRLRRSAESTGSPVINLNLNLVFIVGCLLAAVVMISAVAIYKTKTSKVKYQPLPAYES